MLPSEQNWGDVSGICIPLQNKALIIYSDVTQVDFEFSSTLSKQVAALNKLREKLTLE